MNINFKTKFLDIDLDSSGGAHSKYYIQMYLNTTKQNFKIYNNLIKEYTYLTSIRCNTVNNTTMYTFLDETAITNLKNNIKRLLREQTKSYDNLIKYLEKEQSAI
jgi:hypothetical protein